MSKVDSLRNMFVQRYLPTHVTVQLGQEWVSGFRFCAERGSPAHVLTAWNPGELRPSEPENEAKNQSLKADLIALGFDPFDALGSDPTSPHSEKSFAVSGLSDDVAKDLGKKYGQLGVFRISEQRQTVLGCFEDIEVSRGSLLPIGFDNVAEWLTRESNRDRVLGHVKSYFEKRPSSMAWQGQHFEWFASRTSRTEFNEVDIAALGALSINLPAQTTRELIEDTDLQVLLNECSLWLAKNGDNALVMDEAWMAPALPFARLFEDLKSRGRWRLGHVAASKLMAAKFPGMIPVFDSKVSSLLHPRPVRKWWSPMVSLAKSVLPLLDEAQIDRTDINVTGLRKLDVMLWMEAKDRGF